MFELCLFSAVESETTTGFVITNTTDANVTTTTTSDAVTIATQSFVFCSFVSSSLLAVVAHL